MICRFSQTFTLLASFPHANPQFCCQKWRLGNSGEEEQFGFPFVSCVKLAHPSWTQNPVQSLGDWFWRQDTFKHFFIFNWRTIDLQYCVGFCHTTLWIYHKYTYIPSLLNLPPSPHPIPPLWVVTEHVDWAPCVIQQLPTSYLFYTTKVHLVKALVFPVVRYGCESWTVKKAELMLLKCGVGEDSWESLGLQGDPTSPS